MANFCPAAVVRVMGFVGIMAGSDYTPRLTSTDLNHPGRPNQVRENLFAGIRASPEP